MIETEILAIAGRRGWDFPELEPSGKYACRFRLTHRVRRTDSDLSERIILQLTKDMIYILKLLHQINAPDTSIQYSTQKYLDRNAISIRQLQAFL